MFKIAGGLSIKPSAGAAMGGMKKRVMPFDVGKSMGQKMTYPSGGGAPIPQVGPPPAAPVTPKTAPQQTAPSPIPAASQVPAMPGKPPAEAGGSMLMPKSTLKITPKSMQTGGGGFGIRNAVDKTLGFLNQDVSNFMPWG